MRRNTRSRDGEWTVSIVETVAREKGADPAELPPLYGTLDPEYLERLLESADVPITVAFSYGGRTVIAGDDGDVRVANGGRDGFESGLEDGESCPCCGARAFESGRSSRDSQK